MDKKCKPLNKSRFLFFCSVFILSSCVSNTVNVKPDTEEYSHLVDTPVYIKRSSDKDINTFEGELDPKVLVTNLEKTERKLINISVPYITSGIKDEEEKYKKDIDFTMEINKILYQISKT